MNGARSSVRCGSAFRGCAGTYERGGVEERRRARIRACRVGKPFVTAIPAASDAPAPRTIKARAVQGTGWTIVGYGAQQVLRSAAI